MLSKRQKGLLVITVPFLAGFILGAIVGSCNKESSEPAAVIAEAESIAIAEQDQISEKVSYEGLAEGSDTPESTEPASVAEPSDEESGPAKEIIYNRNRLPYAKLFDDINPDHLALAKKVGLSSIPKTRTGFSASNLVKIEDNDLYVIEKLKYSVPYLTKGAAHELDIIGRAFRDSLKRKGLLDYKLVVSSVLRTEEDVQRLRRSGNPNASENSAHCYGTTFDITYTKYFREDESKEFMQPFELTKVLGEVLLDQKKAGHCLVKYERKEHCFHITTKLVK